MLAETLVIVIATLLLLVLAVGVIVALAVTRRTPEDWENRIRSMVRRPGAPRPQEEQVPEYPDVEPVPTSFSRLSAEESLPGSAYVRAHEVPGHGRIEQAAHSLEDRFQKDASPKDPTDA